MVAFLSVFLRWLRPSRRTLAVGTLLTFAALLLGQATDPSVNTFPKWRLAGGASGVLTEATTSNQLLITLTGTAAAADTALSVNTFPRVRLAGGTTGNLAEVDSTGHLLVTGISTALTDGDYGDVTVSSSGTVITIDASVITNAKIADMAQSTIKGRAAGAGTGAPQDLTATQATAILDAMVGDSGAGGTKGLAPAPAAGDAAALKFLKADGTWATPAGVSGGAANKIAYWTGATTLSNDTNLHWDSTGNNLGIGAATFGSSLTNGIALTHDGTNFPTTNITDTVQVYAKDQTAGNAALHAKGEAGGITSLGDYLIVGNGGTLLSSSVAIGGIQLTGVGSLLQMSNTASIAHGMTGASVNTATFLDIRPVLNTEGGAQIRGLTETNLGLILSAGVVTDPVSTKSTTSDGAIRIEAGKKFISSIEAMAAGVNLVVITDDFAGGLGTRWILDNDGDTWQTGGAIQLRTVEANTAVLASPNLLAAADESNKIFTNEGIAAKNYHTLPTAAVGLQYTFFVQDADGIRVTANTADTVRIGATVSAAAGYCESTTIGDTVTFVAINAIEWVAIAYAGTWTCT